MKRKAVLFPYNSECSAIIKNRKMLKAHNIVACISPCGYGLDNRDVAYAYGGEEEGIIVSDDDFSKIDFEDLLVCESNSDFDMIISFIEEVVHLGKNVYFLYDLEEKEKNRLKNIFNGKENKCILLEHRDIDVRRLILDENEIIPLAIPVIFVAGVIENVNKFDVQLGLREYFLDKGYKVSQIGSKKYCELFGFHSIPDFLYRKDLSEKEKIIWFNRMCKSIELAEKPDVFIIGIPGATMVYNNIFTNNFGITAFEISNAIRPDASIICLPYEDYDFEFLKMIKKSSKYKYDMQVECFNMSNKQFDPVRSKGEKRMLYVTVDTKLVDKRIAEIKFESNIPVYNSFNRDSSFQMYGFILDKLTMSSCDV